MSRNLQFQGGSHVNIFHKKAVTNGIKKINTITLIR